MVREATLRLSVDARQAKAQVEDFNRATERMNTTVVQSTVSTDRLERQLEVLNRVTIDNARNTALMRASIERMAQGQRQAGREVERTTVAINRQDKVGKILIKTFGGLAARTAATGGAFLAVDFLARVAGANSLFGLMNDALDKVAKGFRDAFIEAKSFNDTLKEIGAGKPLSPDELAAFLTQAASKSRSGLSSFVPGYDKPFTIPKLAGENEFLAGGIQKELAEFEADIKAARAAVKRQFGSPSGLDYDSGGKTFQAYERLRSFETFRAGQAQADIDRLGAFFGATPETAKRAADAIERVNFALASTVAIGGPRSGAGIAGAQKYTGLGFPSLSPQGFAIGAGGLAIQGAAGATTAGIGRDLSGFTSFGGQMAGNAQPAGFWGAQIAGAGAYASALAAVEVEHKKLEKQQQRAKRNAEEFGQTVAASFEDAVFNARNFQEGLENVLRTMVRVIFNQLVTQQLAAGIAGLFPTASAKGNVFHQGSLVPFAYGGIVTGPTTFPMSGGKRGLMGEAGPEAIMPLGRNAKGELGVKGGGNTYILNVTAQDAASFRRYSQKQMAADLARATRGNR